MEYSMWIGAGILVVMILLLASFANKSSYNFYQIYKHYDKIFAGSYLTGNKFAQLVNAKYFSSKIKIVRIDGILTDGYDYRQKLIGLSDNTINNASISSLSIVAHEFGHALQHKEDNKKFYRCLKLKRFISILGAFIFPFMIAGIIMLFFEQINIIITLSVLGFGIILFLVALFTKLSLLPVEKDASNKGLRLLEETDALNERELDDAKVVLTHAYKTYVGDFLKSLLIFTGLTRKNKLY